MARGTWNTGRHANPSNVGNNSVELDLACWTITDAEARKRGEQTGLDTLVVHAVNDGY